MTSTTTPPRPKIGVGVFILRRNSSSTTTTTSNTEFILGLRRGSHGSGTWALPGGHLEMNESFETCAVRETLEETGLTIRNVRFLTATNDIMSDEGKHYVTVFVVGEVDGDEEPRVEEPEKCEAWEWVKWEDLVGWVHGHEEGQRRLFLPLVNLVRQRQGVVPLL